MRAFRAWFQYALFGENRMKPADIETIHALYVGNRHQLYTYALSITGDRETAEDAIHGVFERLLQGERLPADLRPYVFRSIRNAAYDAWRRAKVRAEAISVLATEVDAAVAAPLDPGAAVELEPLLRQLSPDEREAILLKIHGGLTFQQIADSRGVPLPTVASWYRRGIDRLKTLLTRDH
jgi:RNA polymerase sigma-70 factor (ECF subfamily)